MIHGQAGTDEARHVSLGESLSEAEQLTDLGQLSITCEAGCLCTLGRVPDLSRLPWRGRAAVTERAARGDGRGHSSWAHHCSKSVTSAQAQSSFCAN